MLPAIVMLKTKVDLHKRTPLRTLRLADEMQARFVRSAIRLVRITGDTGADDILPGRRAAPISRNNVVEI